MELDVGSKRGRIEWDPLNGQAFEVKLNAKKCKKHRNWQDEYGTWKNCDKCNRFEETVYIPQYIRRPEYDAPTPEEE